MNRILLAIGSLIVLFLVVSSSLFIVDQRQVAVIKTFRSEERRVGKEC